MVRPSAGCTDVGGYWVGTGEGYTGCRGVLPSHRGEVPVQRRGPRKPSGAGVGGTGAGRAPGTVGGDGPGTTLRARSVTPGALPVPGPRGLPTYGQ